MKKTFVIGINTLSSVQSYIYSNHIHFFTATAKNHPDWNYILYTPPRMSIDRMRNEAAKVAMETEADYLMFVDDDVMIPPETLDYLVAADKDIIAGLVIIRGMPFNNMAFKYTSPFKLEHYNDLPLGKECEKGHKEFDISCDACHISPLEPLVKCDAVGFSCCLIKTDVIKAMEPPYFLTGTNHTEDIYFCVKTRELEPKPEIWLHTEVKCGHLLNPEPIEWQTRRRFQNFYKGVSDFEPLMPHNEEHIKQCVEKVNQ